MPAHVLVRGLIAGDLHGLHGTQHRHPDELQAGPPDQDQRPGVFFDDAANGIVDKIATGIFRSR